MDDELESITWSAKELRSIALNHHITYTKKIPPTIEYKESEIRNDKYKSRHIMPAIPKRYIGKFDLL